MGDRSKELAEYITQSLFFGEETQRSEGISADAWAKYLNLGSKVIRKKGEYIIRTGENSQGLFYIKKGRVKSNILGKDGLVKTLSVKSDRTIFAEQFLFHHQPGVYETIALEDCELYFFPRDVIMRLMRQDFEITMFITTTMAITSRMLATQIQDMTVRNIQQSLARILYSICCYNEKNNTDNRDSIHLTHEDLANMLGAHRVTVTKSLNQLKQLGVLEYKYEKIIITSKQRLKELAAT